MIRVEIIDHDRIVILRKYLIPGSYRIGRHSSNELVIPSPNLSRFAGVLLITPDRKIRLKQGGFEKEIRSLENVTLGNFKLVFTDLGFNEDEVTQEIKLDKKRYSERTLAIGGVLMMSLILIADFLIFDFSDSPLKNGLQNVVGQGLVWLSLTLLLSFLCRVISGKFKFWTFCNICLVASFGAFLFKEDFFGSRWLLGRMGWPAIIQETLAYLFVGLFLFITARRIFDHAHKYVLVGFGILIVGLLVFLSNLDYLRTGDSFSFRSVQTPPLLYSTFEHSPLEIPEWLDKVDKIAADVSQNAEALTDEKTND